MIIQFYLMEAWEAVLSVRAFEDYTVRGIRVPEYNEDDRITCLGRCEENLCGNYGTNWGCPPDMDIDPEELYNSSSDVLLVSRTFCLDVKDKDVLEATGLEMQKIVRMMVVDLRSNNMDCLGFADGACRYCGVCAYPEPCRFPEMVIPSISSLGLDMKSYLNGQGIPFAFSDTCVTLYGLIFLRKAD